MTRLIRMAALLACALPLAAAAQQGAQITPNYKDADINQVIEAVSQVTGKSFIVDPRVRAQVTMLSTTPMSPDAFYEAFLAILQVYDYIAVPSGNVIKILPNLNARQVPANDLPDRVSSTSDEIVTQVIRCGTSRAGQLVPILRPMMPQAAHLAAYPSANMLIISDRAANVNRIMRIVQRIDRSGDEDIEVIRLEHASADEIVRVINSLSSAQGADAAARPARRRRRAHQQRARERREVAAPAAAHAGRPPRHAARGRRRHAGALPALCRCREARRQAEGAVRRGGRRRRRRGGRAGGRGARRRPTSRSRSGRTPRPTRSS